MKPCPAIALIEFNSIAAGVTAGDAMIKKAPILMLKAGTVSRGKYLVLIGGSVASVQESYNEGLSVGKEMVIDNVFLADIHPQTLQAILGMRQSMTEESFGIIETASVAATIEAADAAIKWAAVNIIEIRLADALGGKAFVMLNGKIENIEAAIEKGMAAITNKALWRNKTIIPALHHEFAQAINEASRFSNAAFRKLSGGEE